MKIISFAGQMASGKTTIANYIVSKFNFWNRIAFGDGVKQIFMKGFDLNGAFINEHKRENNPPTGFQKTVRQALQFIGDGFREIKSDVWIEKLFRTAEGRCIMAECPNHGFVLDDVRYFNEAKAIKQKCPSAINVLIWRPGHENDDPHPSESQLKPVIEMGKELGWDGPIVQEPDNLYDFDYFFINDSPDLESLYTKIDKSLEHFLGYLNE